MHDGQLGTEVRLLADARHRDERGWLTELWRGDGAAPFVQQNLSWSERAGTVRGLHAQAPPMAQGKLIRVVRGALFDVAVDLRAGAGFGTVVANVLRAGEGTQLWVPPGFAHGFCTVEPDTEVLYSLTCAWSPGHEIGLAWDDPDLAIPWPLSGAPVLSPRDRAHPRLRDLASPFGPSDAIIRTR